ncbi:MAG: hypothetical protein ACRD3S_08690, partial [Terracidiphilus sp.]
MNATKRHSIDGVGELPSRSNYLIGADQRSWHRGVPSYSNVAYRGLYPGVDLVFYYSENNELEYDLKFTAGASAKEALLRIAGCDRLWISARGDLIMEAGGEKVVLHRPVAYQPRLGSQRPVEARFVLENHNQVGFEVGAYDRSLPLVIDPQLTYSSYLGGSANDTGWRVAVDADGYA